MADDFYLNELRNEAEPAELYDFTYQGVEYSFTSSDMDLVYNGKTYKSVPIQRSEIEVTNDIAKSTLKINMDKNNPIAVLFIQGSLTEAMFVKIWYAHLFMDATMERILMYEGRVTVCDFSGIEAKLNCEPIFTGLKRMGLRRKYETTCSYYLYDPHTCWLGRTGGKKEVTYSGFAFLEGSSKVLTILKNGLSADSKLLETRVVLGKAVGYYAGGTITWAGGGTFFISKHVVNETTVEITLYRHVPVSALPPVSVTMSPGCDHTMSTCQTVFQNLANFSGFPLIPDKNPFRDSNVPSGGK